ncbi:MAG: hypothetical protein ABJC09_08455 [Terriglobia bacterium]
MLLTGPHHGKAITRHIRRASEELLRVETEPFILRCLGWVRAASRKLGGTPGFFAACGAGGPVRRYATALRP